MEKSKIKMELTQQQKQELKNLFKEFKEENKNFKTPTLSLDYLEIAKSYTKDIKLFLNFIVLKTEDEKIKKIFNSFVEDEDLNSLPKKIDRIEYGGFFGNRRVRNDIVEIINKNYLRLTELISLITTLTIEKKSVLGDLGELEEIYK